MKTNRTLRPIRRPRPLRALPPPPRPPGDFLHFCLYPGMEPPKPALPLRYPTAV